MRQRRAGLLARGRIKPHPDLLFAPAAAALGATPTTTLAATAVTVAPLAVPSPIAAIATATIAAIAAAIATTGAPGSAATITAAGLPVSAALPGAALARDPSALSTATSIADDKGHR